MGEVSQTACGGQWTPSETIQNSRPDDVSQRMNRWVSIPWLGFDSFRLGLVQSLDPEQCVLTQQLSHSIAHHDDFGSDGTRL